MNFLKAGIFKRRTDEPEEQEYRTESGGMLAVWGSPGSGKTTTAVKLAKALADKKRNVVLLLCDMTAPMLPCICHANELECDYSLGSILAAARINENLIKHNMVTLKRNAYMTILGLRRGENEYTYPPYTEVQAVELLNSLRNIAPHVIVDCGSYIANDILSAVALMEADNVLRLANCDRKTLSYFASQLKLLYDSKWEMDKHYNVVSNLKPEQAAEQLGQELGGISFKLPYSQELEEQYLAGTLLSDLTMKDSRAFRKELDKIIKEVF